MQYVPTKPYPKETKMPQSLLMLPRVNINIIHGLGRKFQQKKGSPIAMLNSTEQGKSSHVSGKRPWSTGSKNREIVVTWWLPLVNNGFIFVHMGFFTFKK